MMYSDYCSTKQMNRKFHYLLNNNVYIFNSYCNMEFSYKVNLIISFAFHSNCVIDNWLLFNPRKHLFPIHTNNLFSFSSHITEIVYTPYNVVSK